MSEIKCLTISEVRLLINNRFAVNVNSNEKGGGKKNLKKSEGLQPITFEVLQYCNRFAKEKTEEQCLEMRKKASKLLLPSTKQAEFINLAPENHQEAIGYFPELDIYSAIEATTKCTK